MYVNCKIWGPKWLFLSHIIIVSITTWPQTHRGPCKTSPTLLIKLGGVFEKFLHIHKVRKKIILYYLLCNTLTIILKYEKLKTMIIHKNKCAEKWIIYGETFFPLICWNIISGHPSLFFLFTLSDLDIASALGLHMGYLLCTCTTSSPSFNISLPSAHGNHINMMK